MVGRNAVELRLPTAYSRLHPVFNVSLLMPYFHDDGDNAPLAAVPELDPLHSFTDWASTRYILDYRSRGFGLHEYLVRDSLGNNLDDEWRLLSTLSPDLDPFLQAFHLQSPSRGSGPPREVWKRRMGLQVQ